MYRYLQIALLAAMIISLEQAPTRGHGLRLAMVDASEPRPAPCAPAAEFVPAVASGALSLTPPIAAAGPATPFLFWLGQAAAATSIDGFIDVAIAVVLGLPTPGGGGAYAQLLDLRSG